MQYEIRQGNCLDALKAMEAKSVNCCITSPPYFGLRDYGNAEQIGLEKTPDEFVAALVEVFREVWRVLADDGVLFLNLGDSYNSNSDMTRNDVKAASGLREQPRQQRGVFAGLKPKDLIGIPWRVAFALQADGWYLRSDIIWHKPNPMPESVTDRPTKAHEYLFLLTKSQKYFYDADAIKEAGVGREKYFGSDAYSLGSGRNDSGSYNSDRCVTRNKRSVWTVATQPFSAAHFATFPPKLIEPCVLAGCPKDGVILDPFGGAGTTGLVAMRHKRRAILCELNPDYCEIARQRLDSEARGIHPSLFDEPAPRDATSGAASHAQGTNI